MRVSNAVNRGPFKGAVNSVFWLLGTVLCRENLHTSTKIASKFESAQSLLSFVFHWVVLLQASVHTFCVLPPLVLLGMCVSPTETTPIFGLQCPVISLILAECFGYLLLKASVSSPEVASPCSFKYFTMKFLIICLPIG